MSMMKAIRIHEYGDLDVLSFEDAPRPTPGEDEVLLRIETTSVNPFDCAVRAGYLASLFNYSLPLILGTDVCGTVAEVGSAVKSFEPGDSVYARVGVMRDGAYAEYATAPQVDVAFKPKTLDAIHAGVLPHVSLTAWQALFELGELSEDQTVLVHGAGGGVGHVATQLAHLRGAKVIGTASTNLDFVRELGVEQAVDYTAVPFEEVVQDVDVVLDTVGGDVQERSFKTLKPNGILVSVIQEPAEEMVNSYGVRSAMVYSTPPIGEVLSEIANLVDEGLLKPYVSDVLPLEEVARAHEMVQGRHTRGKLALQVAE
jgi:NADPH:quinone reductase-like Zn-dependent oxidoreductase